MPSDVNNKRGSHINPNFTGSSVSQNEAVVKNKSMQQDEKSSQETKKSLKSSDDEYLDGDKPDIRYSMQKDFQKAFFGREESELLKIVDKKAMERQYEYGEQIHVLLENDDNSKNQKLVILTAALDNDFTIKSVYLLENSDYNIHSKNKVVNLIVNIEEEGESNDKIRYVFRNSIFDDGELYAMVYNERSHRFNRLGKRNRGESSKNVQVLSDAEQNGGRGSGSNQNNAPTKFSLKERQDVIDAHEKLLRENDKLREANQILKEELSRTDGHTFGTKARTNTRTIAARLIREYKPI